MSREHFVRGWIAVAARYSVRPQNDMGGEAESVELHFACVLKMLSVAKFQHL